MEREIIYLTNGETIRSQVNGKTLDGTRGFVLVTLDTGNLRRSLMESAEIDVVKRPDGEWQEVNNVQNIRGWGRSNQPANWPCWIYPVY